MSDTALNQIIQYGTAAARAAFTPSPAAGSQVLYVWYDSDASPDTWVWNGASWVQINDFAASSHNLLSATHGDTVTQTVSRGSIIYGNATPKWDELVIGAANTLLKSDGTDVSWGTVDLLSAFHGDTLTGTVVRGDLIVGNSTPKWARLAVGAASSILTSDGTDASWDTTPAMAGVQVNGRIAPAQLVANTDDYNPTDLHTTYELSISASGAINLTGLNAGLQGELHVIINDGTNTITLKHATTSAAANQFWCPGAADFSLSAKSSANLMYDATAQKWLVSGGTSATGTVTTTGSPASGNLAKFSGTSSITNADLTGDVTTSGGVATTIANSAVTLAKIANAAANSKLLGSGSAGSGAAYSEITLGSGLSMSGTTLSASGAGDGMTVITKTIDDSVTNSATLTSDSELTFATVNGTCYVVDFYIYYTGTDTTADYKYAFNVPVAAASDVMGYGLGYTTTGGVDAGAFGVQGTGVSPGGWPAVAGRLSGVRVANGKYALSGKFVFTANGTGPAVFQFAQNTQTAAQTVKTLTGSFIKYKGV